MTPMQIQLIQSTWEKIVVISDSAATLFYDRLFELDPELNAPGRSLGDCGVEGAHYAAVCAALMRTLERGFADDLWTAETGAALTAVYAALTSRMQDGTAEAQRPEMIRGFRPAYNRFWI